MFYSDMCSYIFFAIVKNFLTLYFVYINIYVSKNKWLKLLKKKLLHN